MSAAALAAVLMVMNAVGADDAAAQGVHIVRGGLVGFATGDDVNCATGVGVVGGAELRRAGRWFVGAGGDLFAAAPVTCTMIAPAVAYDGGHADEFAGVTLLFAPRLSVRVGGELTVGAVRVEPSLATGATYAPGLWDEQRRRVLPWAGGALGVRPRAWRAGLIVEHGYHRVPVTHQVRAAGGWRTINAFGRWRPVTHIGLSVRQ